MQEAFLRLFQAGIEASDDEGLRRYVSHRGQSRCGPVAAARAGRTGNAGACGIGFGGADLDVVRIFSELKPRERALLWLAYVEGDTHAGIAASLRLARAA